MSIMENKDLTKVVTVPDIQKTYSCGDPHWYSSIGDTDGDVLFSEEILKSIPAAAKHWDEYNDKNLWAKERFHNEKYVAVACIGDEHDYTYEEVGYTNHWKEARKYYFMGADVYCGNQRVYFVNHKAVQKAFDVIRGLFLNRQSFMWDDDFLDIEDVIEIEEAYKVLDQNSFKINETWEEKIRERSRRVYDPLTISLMDRHPRFMFNAIDTDDLPF